MEKSPEKLWAHCLHLIQQRINTQQYDTWFSPIGYRGYNEEEKELLLFVPTQYIYDRLDKDFRQLMYQAVYHVFGYDTKLLFTVEVLDKTSVVEGSNPPMVSEEERRKAARKKGAPRLTLDTARKDGLKTCLNYEQTFDNFIEGESNRLLRTVGIAIAEHPEQQTFNPLFIWGPSGVGKTHLVNAIGSRLEYLHPKKRVLYVAANNFVQEYTEARKQNLFNDFMAFYQSIDVLILDDVHEFASLKGTLDTFFHIFNHLHQNGRQIILTCDRPPSELSGMEERLLSRFKWGLAADIKRPEEMLRHNILLSKMRRDGLELPVEVVAYIAHTVTESVRELEGAVHSLMAYSVVWGQPNITLDFARKVLEGQTKGTVQKAGKKYTFDHILEAVASSMNLPVADILGRGRRAEVSLARQVVMYLVHKHTTLSSARIGNLLGGRSHATVLHGIASVEKQIAKDSAYAKQIKNILR